MRTILTPTACALVSLIAGVTMSATLLIPVQAQAAAHRGGGVSKVEDLPVREGEAPCRRLRDFGRLVG